MNRRDVVKTGGLGALLALLPGFRKAQMVSEPDSPTAQWRGDDSLDMFHAESGELVARFPCASLHISPQPISYWSIDASPFKNSEMLGRNDEYRLVFHSPLGLYEAEGVLVASALPYGIYRFVGAVRPRFTPADALKTPDPEKQRAC